MSVCLLTLELIFVLICCLVLSDEDLGSHVQANHTRTGNQEEHNKLLAHYPQRLVFPAVHRGWRKQRDKITRPEYHETMRTWVRVMDEFRSKLWIVKVI